MLFGYYVVFFTIYNCFFAEKGRAMNRVHSPAPKWMTGTPFLRQYSTV